MAIGGLCSRGCPLRDFLDTLERLHHCSRACAQRRPSGTRAADTRTATRSWRQTCPAAHHSSRRDRCHGVTAHLAPLTIVTSMHLPPPVDPTPALVECIPVSGKAHLALLHQSKLLKRVAIFGSAAAAHGKCPGHLAHVEVSLGIEREAVRRSEAAGCRAVGCAPARQQLAGRIENAETCVTHSADRAEAI